MTGRHWMCLPAPARGRMVASAVATLVALVVSACSVGVQDHPQAVVAGPLTAPMRSVAAGGSTSGRAATVFFVRDGRLLAVRRWLPAGDPLAQAIDALVAGPGAQDPPGLHSALPSSVTALPTTLAAGVATIAVPSDFDRIGARGEVLALGQLVFTAMAQSGVGGVRLTSGGTPIQVPTDSGRFVDRPVTRADYSAIAPL